jgi:hypothetical protein
MAMMSDMGMFEQLGATFPFVLGVFERLEPNRQVFRCLDQFSSLGDQKDGVLVQFLDVASQHRRLFLDLASQQ